MLYRVTIVGGVKRRCLGDVSGGGIHYIQGWTRGWDGSGGVGCLQSSYISTEYGTLTTLCNCVLTGLQIH